MLAAAQDRDLGCGFPASSETLTNQRSYPLALDSRDTEILGPLPLAPSVILRAKVAALIMFAAGFAAALNVVPAMIHPVVAVSRLRPSTLHVATLIAAHIASTTAAATFGFVAVLGLRELLHAILGTTVPGHAAQVVDILLAWW